MAHLGGFDVLIQDLFKHCCVFRFIGFVSIHVLAYTWTWKSPAEFIMCKTANQSGPNLDVVSNGEHGQRI